MRQGAEGAEAGGLYTRIVINDMLSQYLGRAPFQPVLVSIVRQRRRRVRLWHLCSVLY